MVLIVIYLKFNKSVSKEHRSTAVAVINLD